jgi:hypothetical protein
MPQFTTKARKPLGDRQCEKITKGEIGVFICNLGVGLYNKLCEIGVKIDRK